MDMDQVFTIERKKSVDLADRICLIVELWGEGEALDGDRVEEIALNLYGARAEEVLRAIIANLRTGRIKGKFYVNDGYKTR